jgi:hypothetical protein
MKQSNGPSIYDEEKNCAKTGLKLRRLKTQLRDINQYDYEF